VDAIIAPPLLGPISRTLLTVPEDPGRCPYDAAQG
jgi:hypothetical protein